MKNSARLALIVAGSVILLALNFRRDLHATLRKNIWKPVKRETLHRSVTSAGVMEAIQVSTVKSDVDEIVEKKFVEEGQTVKKNQPLLQLSRTHTQLEYEQEKNNFMNADSDFRKAVREEEIQKKLFRSNAVPRSQVEDAARNAERTRAAREIAYQQFQLAEKKLNGTLVVSPMNGVVLKDFTMVGGAVSPGKEMITVGDTSRFIVRTKVDELDIPQVKIGQTVEIRADAYPDHVMRGKVSSIASEAERETFAKVEVLIDIVDPDGVALKHNLSVRDDILTEDIPSALGIPTQAVLRKQGDVAWVMVRNALSLVREKKIKLGRPAGGEIEVISGLKEGEQVGLPIPVDAGGNL